MISLILMTYRPGGLDLFANSFTGLENEDYELVVVDDWPGRVARGKAQEFLRSKGVRLGWYGGSKQKSVPLTKCGYVNAVNTGAIHARGDYLVFVGDYSFLHANWVAAWNIYRKNVREMRKLTKVVVCGGMVMYHAPKPDLTDDVFTWKNMTSVYAKWPWVPRDWETAYWGCPREFVESINGLDERCDHCITYSVASTLFQAKALGYAVDVEPMLTCHMVDHRIWHTEGEVSPWGDFDGLWRIVDSRSIDVPPTWECPSPNRFDFKKLREEALRGK